jgi:hypothetical protein
MTAPGTERRSLFNEIGAAITNVAVPHHELPAAVLCRWIVVVIVVIGAALLGFSLSRTPGESSFYWPNRPRPTFSRTKRRSRSIVTFDGYDDLYSNSPSLGMRPQSCPARQRPNRLVALEPTPSAVRTSK